MRIPGQKAPSAKGCIKTYMNEKLPIKASYRQKAPSPKGCIKNYTHNHGAAAPRQTESTERQRVH